MMKSQETTARAADSGAGTTAACKAKEQAGAADADGAGEKTVYDYVMDPA